ncbi:MAG: DUF4386 domain-containing protein [Anaerolineae bacterium]
MNANQKSALSEGGQTLQTDRPVAANWPSPRKIAIATGVLFLITHVTSVGAVPLYGPILNEANYILGSGPDTSVLLGVLFEVILALAIVGTAVALYPIVKGQNEGVALGYVGLRTLEAGIIAVGVIPLLTIVTLRQHSIGTVNTDPATLVALGKALAEFHNWTFLVGPGLVCGTNTVLMAYLMYKSRLVPRFIPVLGLVGGPLIFAYNAAKMFGLDLPAWTAVVVVPIFAWELTLAIRLIVKGFNSPAAASNLAQLDTHEILGVA